MRGGGRRVHRRVRGRAPNANLSRAKGAANARFALRALLASALRLRNAVRMLVSFVRTFPASGRLPRARASRSRQRRRARLRLRRVRRGPPQGARPALRAVRLRPLPGLRCRSAAAIPGAHGARSWWRRASRSVPRRASLLGRGCEWTDGGASRGWHRGGGWCRGAWAGSHRRGSGASASSVCVTCTFDPRCSASS